MAARIPVATPQPESGAGYDIRIEHHLLTDGLLEGVGLGGRAAIVTNTTLAPLYGEMLAARLPGAALFVLPDGEAHKTLDSVARLYADFVAAGLDRKSTVVALGGGVIGDTAGFAAASYMRGVDFVQMPTSLLAMVDASVGGKVGVDLPEGKNLVGAFKQPCAVLIDPQVLRTLPMREWRCGMAEVLKHGLLADPALLDPTLHDPTQAETLIARAVQVKVDVVQRDPFERGERAHLNLGHTFAHAIEQATAYAWPHGEAVGVGLLAAARLSESLGLCDLGLASHVESVLREVGLPTRARGLNPEALYAAMQTDKKWVNGRSRFVLLEGIGAPLVVEDVPKAAIIEVLESLV